MRAIPTKTNEAQGFATDARGPGRHLTDMLHALDARAFSQSLVEPGVSSVEVEDVAQGGVSRLLHSRRGNVAHGDAWRRNTGQNILSNDQGWRQAVKWTEIIIHLIRLRLKRRLLEPSPRFPVVLHTKALQRLSVKVLKHEEKWKP